MNDGRDWFLVIPGSRWDDVAGTDRQLAVALAEHGEVLWVDPAYPVTALAGRRPPCRNLHQVAPHVHRLQPIGPPGSSRRGIRRVATSLVQARVEHELSTRGIRPRATIVMTTRTTFPRRGGGVRVFFVTDDWVAGADMMGLSRDWLAGRMTEIAHRAQLVVTVTQELADTVRFLPEHASSVSVIPNGTRPFGLPPVGTREHVVGLVGQLNERIDYAAVTAVADRGVPLRVIGPRTARDSAVEQQLDDLLARDNVEWVGAVEHAELGDHLGRLSVGITPYVDTEFNRASFPLKTLEYLGAGIPVVSSDLPAARWLRTEHVHIARGPGAFADEVEALLEAPASPADEQDRVDFAQSHSWSARADQLLELVAGHR